MTIYDFSRFIQTEYTLFVPDGFHLKQPNGLKKLLQLSGRSSGKVQMLATYAEGQNEHFPQCEQLKFDYR